MADGSLARRYARALISLGEENNCIEQLSEDLIDVQTLLSGSGGALGAALVNPCVTLEERRGIVETIISRQQVHRFVGSFLRLLVDKGRFGIVSEIQREYMGLADELSGRVRAVVTTATALDDAGAAKVRASLEAVTGKQVVVEYEVDADLIGGVVARVGDTVYDASVRARLQDVQESLSFVSADGAA